MTANQLFEKMLKTVTDPEFQPRDNHLTIKLVHEIDDETMCEGYVIDYTNTDYIRCLFWATSRDFPPSTNMEVFMDVEYESCQPVGLIFYDDKEKHHRLFSGPIYDSLKNPFCQIFFRHYLTLGIRRITIQRMRLIYQFPIFTAIHCHCANKHQCLRNSSLL